MSTVGISTVDNSSSELAGRVAIITGAASGFGRAASELFAERGAHLALVDLNLAGLEKTAETCRALGAQVGVYDIDLRSSLAVNDAVEAIVNKFGRVDVLANVAGVPLTKGIAENDDESWQFVFDVNAAGPFYLCRAVLPIMLAQESGSIINVASGQAHSAGIGYGAYAASKGALVAFNRVLALEAAPHVRANVISPGPINSEMFAALAKELAEPLLAATPMRRPGEPRELAEALAFLASDRSSYVTGNVLHVNGGRVMP